MKYSDLISFDPIETVLQLKDANSKDRAKEHAKTFVISSNIKKQFSKVVFPQLQFIEPQDNKGILIVGNYGTGKTHMMSVISSICEYEDISINIDDGSELLKYVEMCQGRFKVIRITIGGTLKSLRNIICDGLSEGLNEIGVVYNFPPQDKIVNHTSAFQEMMLSFNAKYPDKGVLLVIDELLDYLKSRDSQELMRDLAFLREIGEMCKDTRFRFIAGLQESLFDNPSWANLADSVRRVKDRFEQIHILRDDVATVVSKRLLQKTPEQKNQIREYLERFTPLYSNLIDRMSEFVELFPVHPIYLEVFERIHIAERREVLKTLSKEMTSLLDKELPQEYPGLITFDSYWETIQNDPSLMTKTEIKELLDRTRTLEDKIKHSFPKEVYKNAALRIIRGLAVYRMTTPDIYSELGLTPVELRDNLYIMIPQIPQKKADFLSGLIETILSDIITTVSGQYISKNKDSGQYYIDVKKSVDYDQNIIDQAKMVPKDEKDRAYFEILRKLVLENPEIEVHIKEKVWEYDLLWPEKNVERPGYLFFGAPNERSTAKPPKDFYIYFLQMFNKPEFNDEKKSDEIFFEPAFTNENKYIPLIEKYAAAIHLADIQSQSKKTYLAKADEILKEIRKLISDNFTSEYRVIWKGQKKLLKDWNSTPGPKYEIRDWVESVASVCFSSYFEDRYSEYPKFYSKLTNKNREEICKDAIREIINTGSSKKGKEILEALGLYDEDTIDPRASKYAKPIFDIFSKKTGNQVINRSEIFDDGNGWEKEKVNKIESDLVAVVLVALCYHGDIVIAYNTGKTDASNIDSLLQKNMKDIIRFKHIEKPKDYDIPTLIETCKLFGINENLAKRIDLYETMLKEFLTKKSQVQNSLTRYIEFLKSPPKLWGIELINHTKAESYKIYLTKYNAFLDSLDSFNTVPKLVNLRKTTDEIADYKKAKEIMGILKNRESFKDELTDLINYLDMAENILPPHSTIMEKFKPLKLELANVLSEEIIKPSQLSNLKQKLISLKNEYTLLYASLHKSHRLNRENDIRKKELMDNKIVKHLQQLAKISILPGNNLITWTNKISSLKPCFLFTNSDLDAKPRCPHCNYDPTKEQEIIPPDIIEKLDDELIILQDQWTQRLLAEINDPLQESNISLLNKEQQDIIYDFKINKKLPEKNIQDFVQAMMTLIKGLVPVTIPMEEVKKSLSITGGALKPDEVINNFRNLIKSYCQNKDEANIRILFTDTEKKE